MMWLFIYNLIAPVLVFLLKCLRKFLPKLEEFLSGREGLVERWAEKLKSIPQKGRILFHVSSVGELEQSRPVIEYLQSKNPQSPILVSYYSPSVPRLMKDWNFVTAADYLPLDLYGEMKEFFEDLKPEIVILNRYDLWPNMLHLAHKMNIPVALINASTPPLGFWGWFSLHFRAWLFKRITLWSFVDTPAASAWEPFVEQHAKALVAGNPRVDRALQRTIALSTAARAKEKLEIWGVDQANTVVAGSTWEEDEKILLDALTEARKREKKLRMILVPHEPTEQHLKRTVELCTEHGFSFHRFSLLNTEPARSDILIVDARGFLAEIYGIGAAAYVGGGFGKQIHSIIEPLAHGLPVAFGPNFQRTPEAVTINLMGAAFICSGKNSKDLGHWFIAVANNVKIKESVRMFLQMHRGAGERVGAFVYNFLVSHK